MVAVQDSSDSEDESSSIDAPDYSSLSSGMTSSGPSDLSSDESDVEVSAQTSIDTDECEIVSFVTLLHVYV